MKFDFYVVGQKTADNFVLYDARENMGGRACVSPYTIQQLIDRGYSVCGVQKQSKSASLRPKDIIVVNQAGQPATRISTHDDISDTKRSASTISKGLKRSRAEIKKAKEVGAKRSQAIQQRKKTETLNPLLEVYKIERKGGIKRLTPQMVNFLYSILTEKNTAVDDFEQLQTQAGQTVPVYYSKATDITISRKRIENLYKAQVDKLGLTAEGYVNYSFYGSKSKTPQEVARYMLQHTNKRIVYTEGLSYRNPTTYKVPITKERAFKEWDSNGMMDVREYSDYIDMNSYSSSDMW